MSTTKKIAKVVKREVGKGSQDLIFTEIIKYGEHKLKVQIKSDSYDFQSYAKISVFDNLKWNLVDSIHYSKMKTESSLVYGLRGNTPTAESHYHYFRSDRTELLKMAKIILD